MISKNLKNYISKFYTRNLLNRLGYSEDQKLLIIHADDLGLSDSENEASISAMQIGMVNSGSVMVTCPGFEGVIKYAIENPEIDFGIHLTLTSEWINYKWKPVLPAEEVRSLVDINGYFHCRKTDLAGSMKIEDVRREFKAQINKALSSGLDLTHIDSHMFVAFLNDKIRRVYIETGREYNLPVLLRYNRYSFLHHSRNDILATGLYIADPSDYARGFPGYYKQILDSMKPGLNTILVHLAFNTNEMLRITSNEINSGSEWRNAEYDFFISEECRYLIEKNGIQLITWREIRDKLIRQIY